MLTAAGVNGPLLYVSTMLPADVTPPVHLGVPTNATQSSPTMPAMCGSSLLELNLSAPATASPNVFKPCEQIGRQDIDPSSCHGVCG